MPSPSTVLLRTQSDERLVALARGGHDRAFEAIVERYRRPLLRACRRILPEARAEDALQQALMAAWAGLRRGDDVQELRPWLFRIVRNTALNQLRAAGYDFDELVETLGAADDPEEEVVRRAVVRQTLAAVAALPDRQREALLRTAINGHAQADVARDLGLSSTAMRQLVHRARRSVRTAATALVPMPLAVWVASTGGATATATLATAGTVCVLAGGAVTGQALIEDRPPGAHHREAPREAPRPQATATPEAAVLAAAPEETVAVVGPPRERDDARSGGDASRRGDDGRDDRRGEEGRDDRGDDRRGDDRRGDDRRGGDRWRDDDRDNGRRRDDRGRGGDRRGDDGDDRRDDDERDGDHGDDDGDDGSRGDDHGDDDDPKDPPAISPAPGDGVEEPSEPAPDGVGGDVGEDDGEEPDEGPGHD
jgi:RNA polymerase sigma factor (sigma-70 family)